MSGEFVSKSMILDQSLKQFIRIRCIFQSLTVFLNCDKVTGFSSFHCSLYTNQPLECKVYFSLGLDNEPKEKKIIFPVVCLLEFIICLESGNCKVLVQHLKLIFALIYSSRNTIRPDFTCCMYFSFLCTSLSNGH